MSKLQIEIYLSHDKAQEFAEALKAIAELKKPKFTLEGDTFLMRFNLHDGQSSSATTG